MARADGDTALVEDRCNVVGMSAVEYERDHGHLLRGGPQNPEPGDGFQGAGCAFQEVILPPKGAHPVHRVEPIERRAETDDAGDVRGSGFEALGGAGEGRAFEAYALDH